MVRISWVNVWTRSRNWSGFIVYLFFSQVLGAFGVPLPKAQREFFQNLECSCADGANLAEALRQIR
jgi:hypothetical protein